MNKIFLTRLYTTLVGWAIAFAIVYIIFFFFGHELKSLPTPIVALIISGVLVTVMGNFVMPWLNSIVKRNVERM